MRRLLLAATLMLCVPHVARATHLGPVIFGIERHEAALVCKTLYGATFIAKHEEASIKAGETFVQYQNSIRNSEFKPDCRYLTVRHLPRETMYQWRGRYVVENDLKDENRTDFPAMTFSIIRSDAFKNSGDFLEVFIILPDEAPAPCTHSEVLLEKTI
ncbi:MAG: hypothetical protein O2794_01860 [bacterium]|nr:hypothetical protein [bacterium]